MGRSVPRLRAVIFDWGGTLTPWHTFDLAEQWAVYARVVHHDDDLASADLAARNFAAEDAAWQRARTGQGSAQMDDLLREVGVDPADALHEAALTAYRQFWEPHTITDEQVRPVWEGLRERGIRVGILSNTIWVPHSEIPVAQQVSVDVTPDGGAHELLDILDIVDGWQSK